jgi:hypothetical protein
VAEAGGEKFNSAAYEKEASARKRRARRPPKAKKP